MGIDDIIDQIVPEYSMMITLLKPLQTSKVLKRNLKASPDHVTLLASMLLAKSKLKKTTSSLPRNIASDADIILDHVFDVKKSTEIDNVIQDYIFKVGSLCVVYGIDSKDDFVNFVYDTPEIQDKVGILGPLKNQAKPFVVKSINNLCDVILDAPGIGLSDTLVSARKESNKEYINELMLIS